jgi:RNA polymerase sigma-70 factor (ECF subfamily)
VTGTPQTVRGLTALSDAVRETQRTGYTALPDRLLLSVADERARAGGGRVPPYVEGLPAADDGDIERITLLVDAAKQGDNQAFAQIYDRYVDTVYRYVYFRLGAESVAEDVTSETFLRALRRIDTFTWRGRDFGAWLITIARNIVADSAKSSRFRLEVPTAEMLDAEAAGVRPASAVDVEAAVLRRLEDEQLVDALRQLKPDQLECIVLRFFEGFSVAETARVLQRSDGAVKQLQLRALRALAKLLPRADA